MSDLTPVRIFMADLDETRARQAGDAVAGLYSAVTSDLAGRDVQFVCTGVVICCDGCDERTDRFALPAGWHHTADGRDFCVRCLAGRSR